MQVREVANLETRLYVELIPFLTSAVVVAAARFSSNLA
jgi:hypothetical protein